MISERDFKNAVAWRLLVVRTAFGKTQATLGEKLNVGHTAISNYEKADRAVDPYQALILKMSFGIPIEWLYAGDESQLPPALAAKLADAEAALKAKAAS